MKTLVCSLSLLAFWAWTAHAGESPNSPDWTKKVDPPVLRFLAEAPSGETDFLVIFTEQADVSGAARLTTKLAKGTYVFQKLSEVATRTQSPVLRMLESQGIAHQSFWVANMIRVHGNMSIIQQMAQRDEVAHIYANPQVHFQDPTLELGPVPAGLDAPEPGVSFIRAPQVWAFGFTGQGVVVGGDDTGYRWTHNALKGRYRGWNGTVADHNYNWHDSIHSGGGVCGPDSPQPCDDYGHGTHTMGTMVGTDGPTNQIGVAPGAKWMGCRNMNEGVGTPATYSECLQWFIAPTDSGGNNPDPTMAPDVINNSWGCPVGPPPNGEGCSALTLQTPIENVRAAGIVVVVSAGNSGSNGCSTVEDPPAIYEASLTVGATGNNNNNTASFSSRGPVTLDGSNRLKPNVTAPGVNIRSCFGLTSDTEYEAESGTSMAGPHVVGTVALIISAHPELRGDVDAIQNLLEQTTIHPTTTETCGGIPGTTIPNNTFGWGRIDALNAFYLGVSPTPTPTPIPTPSPTPVASATPTVTPSPTASATPTGTPTPTPTPASQPINLSTRMRVETGDNVGIGGFIISGSVPKHVVLRAIGPSLAQAGVPDTLADPVLELHGPGAFVTITNNNWRDDPAQEAAIIASGIAPTNDLESAIDATLSPGAYTAIVRGNNNTSGTGLVEVYDLSPGVPAKLANISTRASVGTGSDVVIAGFILGSHAGNDRVVVRGIGPSLASAGVLNPLANPTLELRDGNGALLIANDDWQDNPVQASELLSAGLAPTNDLESGIAATLPPAPYTALLAGLNNSDGISRARAKNNQSAFALSSVGQHSTRSRTQPSAMTPAQIHSQNLAQNLTPSEVALPMTVAPQTRASFMASWESASGAIGYRLDVSTTRSFSDYLNGYRDLDVGNVTARVVTGLRPGTTYYYRVRAYNVAGSAEDSSVMTGTTVSSAGLVINATFDSSILNNPNSVAIQAMINRAIAIHESLFTDPITLSIRFRYAPASPTGTPFPTGGIAQSFYVVYSGPWDSYISALRADARTSNDTSANASLPPGSLTPNIILSSANGRAVGLNTPPAMFADGTVGTGGPYDGIVTLNSASPFQFTRPPSASNYDAQRLVEHEIDEVIGLGSFIDHATNLRPQDLFSWSGAGVRNTTSSGSRYFSIDGGSTDIVDFSQDADGDFGDWLSDFCPQATPYVQNAFCCPGQPSDISASSPEGINLDVIGYNLGSGGTNTGIGLIEVYDRGAP